ncbi:amino acid permease [Phenylobacterium sp.]|uniref:amino acid permease n=1 Tax=Phenylobacterium sp. TaxID=1871053 RepID=UPI00391D287C
MTADSQTPAGHARIGVLGASALVAGSMIGSGVYLLPATMGAVGSISMLGWVAATGAALAIAGMFAWLGPAAPEARGLAGYVQAGLGRFFGVQTTVVYWCLCWFGNVAIALAVAGYAGYLVPALAGGGARLATTIAVIWLTVVAAWIGPRLVARIEGWTLALGLLPVVAAAVFGWLWFDPQVFAASWNPRDLSAAAAIRESGLNAFWAFLGLESAAAVAAVVRDPARNVPRATLTGVLAAALIYVAASAALMGMMPAAELARSDAPFADAARIAIGVGGGTLIAAFAFIRTAGCLTGWTLVASETTRGAADEGAFLPAFRSRPGERASAINLLAVGVLMSLVAAMTVTPTLGEQFGVLINVAVLLSLYAYALAGLSLIRLSGRFTPGRRVLAIATALVAIGCSLALIATGKPHELLWSLAPVAAGAALYLPLRRR